LDWNEDEPLVPDLSVGVKGYEEFKQTF